MLTALYVTASGASSGAPAGAAATPSAMVHGFSAVFVAAAVALLALVPVAGVLVRVDRHALLGAGPVPTTTEGARP